jgi:outer membrane protein assembly factor BamB
VIKTLLTLLVSFFLINCSFNKNSKIWNEDDSNIYDNKNVKKILIEKEKIKNELNPSLKLDLTKIKVNKETLSNLNNLGSLEYFGDLEKVSNYKFSKFKNIINLNFKPLFFNGGLIFFDNKGSIIKYSNNSKVIWKKNYYSKYEKKLNPKISFALKNENLIIADNVSKMFLLNFSNGDLIWSNNNIYPLNSDIKIFGNKFFLVDYENTLRCFDIRDGSECWNVKTENSFTMSNTKNSLIITNDLVIFSNSIGDITAVDIPTGSIVWQLPTQSSQIINKTYNFEISKLVSDGKFIYFSNNKNQFFSIDIKTGIINWVNEVNSNLTPILIEDLIFTISNSGYLIVMQRKQGNIIRINDVYKYLKDKEREKIKPTGFVIAKNKLYLSNNNGSIIVINLSSGNTTKVQKISRKQISEPFIYNQNLFVIKNGSVAQYN